MTDDHLPTRTEGEGETLDMPEGSKGFLASGQVLGERYQIRSQLGRGGMGEVWRAFDLKLRVEVALKALLPEMYKDERRRDLLRHEVRAAREVVSPNVCRIFDLIEIDGRELVSMEYVDGGTLLGVLQERGPLDLKEAQDIASQFLAGLEAIHRAGLVHRDVKPENIMLTRAGRVVLMDFGLARGPDSDAGTVSGTPAYMAPEQARGEAVGAPADVYAAGVVLAEMVSPDGIKDLESRRSVWDGVRHEPAKVPDTPWAPVLKQAVAKEPGDRYNSAHTLTRALEDVTLRIEGEVNFSPYPGLAFFTEADAEYFFGREAEVEAMWTKLERPHLLALIGPSGAGKSSFLRAGLIPAAPSDWSCVVCTPGNAPFVALGQAMAREMAGDAEAMQQLLRFEEHDVAVDLLTRWREQHGEAVLIVDQFEELFTQNSHDVQSRFAALLGQLALETDLHVLLSMRDDFLFQCHAHQSLSPLFDSMTPIGPPVGGALRRALVQPASKCGYRFEDDNLVEEMLAEVEGERGLLPLLAFAVNRLWEERDQEAGLLRREAYQRLGGVGGALARHAEETLEQIGEERTLMVREIFRNLMTAQGTRAVRDVDELLSVFSNQDKEPAEQVLRQLVDSRLLTTFEVESGGEEPQRRVEIIHESLLANWPRLVRWQTQDADAAQLRDQLRQAAKTWDDHDRSDDLLWSGSAYREFSLWRERYPGGLTEVEENFARAMTRHAKRRKRRRRIAAAAALLALATVAIVMTSLWRRSKHEARRAEAANLVSLGQLELESYPSATVAHAIASLELADGPGARRLALEALWKGPTALVVTENFARRTRFSPDGEWLIQADDHFVKDAESHLSIFRKDGTRKPLEKAHPESPSIYLSDIANSGHFVSIGSGPDSTWEHTLWTGREERRIADISYDEPAYTLGTAEDANRDRHVLLVLENNQAVVDTLRHDGSVSRIGTLEIQYLTAGEWIQNVAFDSGNGHWIAAVVNKKIRVYEIGANEISAPRTLGLVEGAIAGVAVDPLGRFVATADDSGMIKLWSLIDSASALDLVGPPGIRRFRFSPNGSLLEASVVEDGNLISWVWDLSGDTPIFVRRFELGDATWGGWRWSPVGRRVARRSADLKVRVWSANQPADAEPLVLARGNNTQVNDASFSPQGAWLATSDMAGLAFWPLARNYSIVLRGHKGQMRGLVFDPRGRWVASSAQDGHVRLWPLEGDPPPPTRELGSGNAAIAVSPDGSLVVAGSQGGVGRPNLFYTEGGSPLTLPRSTSEIWGVAFSPDGRHAAGISGQLDPAERVIVLWDVAAEEEAKILEVGEETIVYDLRFNEDGHLLSMCASGLQRWNVDTGERELLYEGPVVRFDATPDGRRVALIEKQNSADIFGRTVLLDLDSGTETPLDVFGIDATVIALDPTGTIVATGHRDGSVRVAQLDGGEPHLFLGHESGVENIAIDPLGRWIASGGYDSTIRLWPMPDLSNPPLHTLPREELIAKLKTLTNLRVVRDEDSPTGWKLTHDPFPGWETVPTW